MSPGFSLSNIHITKYQSFICWLCDRQWPAEDAYEICPCCRELCNGSHKPSMAYDAAIKLATEFAFGWWLWDTGKLP